MITARQKREKPAVLFVLVFGVLLNNVPQWGGGFGEQYAAGCKLSQYIGSGKTKYRLNSQTNCFVSGHDGTPAGLKEALKELAEIRQICAKCHREKTGSAR